MKETNFLLQKLEGVTLSWKVRGNLWCVTNEGTRWS